MKVLSIGNSFSQDATAYPHQIAQSAGVNLLLVNLYIGGCSLEQHWNNVTTQLPKYALEINGHSTEELISIPDALQRENWDYVTLQQVSQNSVNYASYQPYLTNLAAFVRKQVPSVKIGLHQTWAYEENSEKLREIGYRRQEEMFLDLQKAYLKAARSIGICKIIPSGWVFQQLLKNDFNNLHRDTYHASIPDGRYILGAVWYELFSGKSILDTSFCPDEMTENKWIFLKEQVHLAMTKMEKFF